MKILEFRDGFLFSDLTEAAQRHDLIKLGINFVEAPDYVFPSWGYDETKEGDERFIKPEAPEGWAYDEITGTFYSTAPSIDELIDIMLGVTSNE